MATRPRAALKAILAAAMWLAASLLLNLAGVAVYLTISELFPENKEKKEVEVTWVTLPAETPPELPATAGAQAAAEIDKDKDKAPAPPEVAKLEPPKPEPPKPEPPKPEPPKPVPPPERKPPEPPKPQAKKPPPKPPETKEPPKVALIPKPEDKKPPEEKKPEEKKPPAQMPKPQRHKMVEVDDDKHLVNEPPPDAEYWSDKNRVVAEQMRDTRTNLEKISKGEASASEKSTDTNSQEVGGEKEKVRQMEAAEATSLEKKRVEATAHSGNKDKAKGIIPGEMGQEGRRGQNGNRGQGGKPGALAMRNLEGRGAPGAEPAPNVARSGANDDAPAVAMTQTPGGGGPSGRAGTEGAAGSPGKRGPKLKLDLNDYQRIAGDDKLKEEAAIAQRQTSHKKGRWEKKMDRVHAALENFTPEVKPGNQTALGTRAAPFAVYIARMHRRIHELWAFGFVDDLDGKSATNPMNNRQLEVGLEIVVNADGSVDKATIIKPSGVLTFDVAAIDTVYSAGPFEETPAVIRSGDGRLYLHWTFHRDERLCSPYFADPFILDNAGSDKDKATAQRGLPEVGDEVARRRREGPQKLSRDKGSPEKDASVMPHMSEEQHAAAARANINAPAPDDPAAQDVALKWASAFEKGDVSALVAVSSAPFKSAGQVVATDPGAIASVYQNVLGEVSSRTIKEWKLLSPAGYRAVFGHLPKGADDADGTAHLYLAVRVGSEWLSMDVAQGKDGKYTVVGLSR
jgi:TonB family protein